MFFIRIIGIVTGIVLVVAIMLFINRDRVDDCLNGKPEAQITAVEKFDNKQNIVSTKNRTKPIPVQQPDSVEPKVFSEFSSTETVAIDDNATALVEGFISLQKHHSIEAVDQTPTDTIEASLGENSADNASVAILNELTEKQTIEIPTGTRHYVWTPFKTRSRAEGFANHMNKLCDVSCKVEKQNNNYRVYFNYQEIPERDSAIVCMQDRAGINLTEIETQQEFVN